MTFSKIKDELGWILALAAFTLSGLSFYVSYIYKNQDLQVQVTSVSYNTNQGEVYMTVAFSNGGNRDAAEYSGNMAGIHGDHSPSVGSLCHTRGKWRDRQSGAPTLA